MVHLWDKQLYGVISGFMVLAINSFVGSIIGFCKSLPVGFSGEVWACISCFLVHKIIWCLLVERLSISNVKYPTFDSQGIND